MRIETSELVKQHMFYLRNDESARIEMRSFKNTATHFYHYLVTVIGLLPDTAQGIVDDFKTDLERQ